ncbi:recombination protein NinB [Riemerella columbina]|uniref:recombination protein NinB n=1 Tax=Riemerella columbina TaxID=103810 RepID=UPI000380F061|nr:recombination protein NinB [Riemerella columbina]
MIFDTSIEEYRQQAINRVKFLLDKKARIEIVEKSRKRSISQNNYLHLILGWYALEYGETLEYIKQEVFKKEVNRDLFQTEYVNKKTGEFREAWKSTANLTKTEMTTAIERFRNYAVQGLGLYLPEPSDLTHLDEIKNELEKHANQIYL